MPATTALRRGLLSQSVVVVYRTGLTALRLPHIINGLGLYTFTPSRMINAIDELLNDDRKERPGLSFDTLIELGALREFYCLYRDR